MKDNKKNDFTFSFKDRKEKGVRYVATYSPDGTLNVSRYEEKVDSGEENSSIATRRPMSNVESWNVFREHATIKAILKAANERPTHWNSITNLLSRGDAVPDINILECVRDYPFILMKHKETNRITLRFIDIMEKATGNNKKQRNEAIKNIKKHFVPQARKVAMQKPPMESSLCLLKKLTRQLSGECKKALNQNVSKDDLANWKRSGDEKTLRDWAMRNDKRISSSWTPEQLKTLIHKPFQFADDVFQTDQEISRRTLMRKK